MTVYELWEQQRDRLTTALKGADDVIVRIPDWEPVDLEEGLRWLQASHYEAFKVDHRITWKGKTATVHFAIWED